MKIKSLAFDNNHMVGQKHANNGQVDDELVGLLFHLVLVSYEDEIGCIYTSHKESPLSGLLSSTLNT